MVHRHELSLAGLLVIIGGLIVIGSVVPGMAAPPGDAQGHRAQGAFDLDAARQQRQALVDRLAIAMPPAARADRIRVTVTDAERDGIAGAAEPRLRVGIVKSLDEAPVRFIGQDLASARGTHGARTAGDATATPDGGYVWAATIEAPGATAIRLHFTGVSLAPGSELYIHTEAGEAFGPYTGRGLLNSGEFWSHTVAGDSVMVQVHQAAGAAAGRIPSSFTIAEIGYIDLTRVAGFPRPDPQAGETLCSYNASCVENANCGGLGIPPAIQAARDAYAHMEFVSGAYLYFCSGGLLTDTPATGTPYFLTANHCVSKGSEANSLQAFFQYDVACDGSCPAASYFYNMNPPPYPRTVGASILSTNRTSDYTLMQLAQDAPAGSVFLGWTSTAVASENTTDLYRISHPGGAPQAYSAHAVDTSKGTCRSWPRGAWIYSRDVIGATEGGSSGSPVLNAGGQVVGQLSGACGYNVGDVCDTASNATVDGAFANYYCSVQPWLNSGDTSCGGGGGGGGGGQCLPKGDPCGSGSDCCSGSCKGKPGSKTCG